MNVIKRIFGTKAAKVWGIVTPVVIALLIAASIVLTTILPGLMDWVFGGESSTVTGAVEAKYTPSEGVTDKETALAAAKERIKELEAKNAELERKFETMKKLFE